jgi:O-acetyl-ADP-ribose deacetylase (regulator of RNase III)
MNGLRLVLHTDDDLLREAWSREFADYAADVEIFFGPLEDVPACDCLVAEGNSFGIMDSDTDTELVLQFPEVQQNLHDVLVSACHGEIPVGQSVIVPTGDDVFHWLAYTPSMRFPRNIPAELVYDCTRATLLAIEAHNMAEMEAQGIADELGGKHDEHPIESAALPGFGLGAGVGALKVAHLMRLAYESVCVRDSPAPDSWDELDPYLKQIYGAQT